MPTSPRMRSCTALTVNPRTSASGAVASTSVKPAASNVTGSVGAHKKFAFGIASSNALHIAANAGIGEDNIATSPHVGADIELAESVSMAMLTVLDTLGPTERAVFVLREVFDTSAYFTTGRDFIPVLLRQREHAREHHQSQRAALFDELLERIENPS